MEMPPSTPPALLLRKPSGVSSSPCVAALLRHAGEAGADLHALDGVDAHHRVGDVGIELVEQRLAETHRHARRLDTAMRAPHRIARLAQRVHVASSCGDDARRWRRRTGCRARAPSDSNGIAISPSCVMQPRRVVPYCSRSHFLRDGAGTDHRRGQARRGTPAAARVAQAVLVPVGVVGVPGAEGLERCCRSPCCAGRCSGSAGRSACRWSCPRTRPRGSATASGSLRCVTWRECRGGADRARAGCRPRRAPCRAGSRRSRSRWPGRGFAEVGDAKQVCRRCCRTWGLCRERGTRDSKRRPVERRPRGRLVSHAGTPAWRGPGGAVDTAFGLHPATGPRPASRGCRP